jgi:hypothetical protein
MNMEISIRLDKELRARHQIIWLINQRDQQALTPTSFDSPASVVCSSSASGLLLLLLMLLMLLLDSMSSPEMVCASHRHTISKAMNTVENEARILIY